MLAHKERRLSLSPASLALPYCLPSSKFSGSDPGWCPAPLLNVFRLYPYPALTRRPGGSSISNVVGLSVSPVVHTHSLLYIALAVHRSREFLYEFQYLHVSCATRDGVCPLHFTDLDSFIQGACRWLVLRVVRPVYFINHRVVDLIGCYSYQKMWLLSILVYMRGIRVVHSLVPNQYPFHVGGRLKEVTIPSIPLHMGRLFWKSGVGNRADRDALLADSGELC
jgi:hypothetical protein